MKLILGSKSFGRRQVLEKAGYTFSIIPADIDEKAIRSDDFEELPLLLARAKAEKLVNKINEPAILITSDQVVVHNGELREQPENEHLARKYLSSYATHPAQTNTAVVVTNTETGKQAEGLSIAKVFFKKIPMEIIDQLIDEGKVLHTAGGFIAEHPLLAPYIDRIEGTIDSITGLPMQLTEQLIQEIQ